MKKHRREQWSPQEQVLKAQAERYYIAPELLLWIWIEAVFCLDIFLRLSKGFSVYLFSLQKQKALCVFGFVLKEEIPAKWNGFEML